MVKNIRNYIKSKYYSFPTGEFLPVYSGADLVNKKQFHIYRLGWIVKNYRAAYYQFTNTRG